jgi:hypothetical protein
LGSSFPGIDCLFYGIDLETRLNGSVSHNADEVIAVITG